MEHFLDANLWRGFENKQEEDTADRNEPRRVFSSRFFGDRSKGELTNFEAIREFVGTKKREFFLRTMARLASNLNIKGDRRTTS